MFLRQIFDPYLAQYAYLVGCQKTGEAIIFDPERDIDRYYALAKENGLKITAAAETHIHADFVSGLQEFAQDSNVQLYVSAEGGIDWSYRWTQAFKNVTFLNDKSSFRIGNIKIEVLHTPGHTPEHLSFLITDLGGGADQPMLLVSGDFLFVGDVGRPDLLESAAGIKNAMEPSARKLRESLNYKLQNLKDYLQILPAHGAGSACGKSLGAVPTSTLGYEKIFNPAFKLALKDQNAFVADILNNQPEPPLYFARMKLVNRDGIKVTGGAPQIQQLKNMELPLFIANQDLKIIDTRNNRKAFDQAHLPSALHAPLHSSFFTSTVGSYLNENDPILLVLNDSAELELASRQLYRIGYDNILAWITINQAQDEDLLTADTKRIDFADFNQSEAIRTGEIIDVRSSAEYKNGHIEGSKSFPYTRLKENLKRLPTGRTLYIHCGSGIRAALASSFLQSQGFEVIHIDGICSSCARISEQTKIAH